MIKSLYTINYWVPNYIGLMNLIAESDKQAFLIVLKKKISSDRISEVKNDYITDGYEYTIFNHIIKSQRFLLLPGHSGYKQFDSGIIHFISNQIL